MVSWGRVQAQGHGLAQVVPINVERSIPNDEAQNGVSIMYFVFVHDPLTFLQREGTARSSMMTDLVEQYTTQDGHIDGEDDIAASVAVTYAGASLYVIFLSSFIPHFRWLRYSKLRSFSVISKVALNSLVRRQSLQLSLSYWLLCCIQKCRHADRKSSTV